MKDYFDMKAVADFDGEWSATDCQDETMTERHDRKIFRRKAARQRAAGELANMPPAQTLPATVPGAWELLRPVYPDMRKHMLSQAPLVSFFRQDPAARAFDLLRTRLMQTLRANGWRRVAIAAPTTGCGATFTAVNLALSLARVPGCRTVLMDLNRRDPGVAGALDICATGDMDGFLKGRVPQEQHLVRCGANLALGLADAPDRNAAETLQSPVSAGALDNMVSTLEPDVVLYDLPPVLEYDDTAAFLPQVDGILLVADGTQTTAEQIAACEEIINGQARVLGVLLNRARQPILKSRASGAS